MQVAESMTPSVRSAYYGRMRLHITLADEAMKPIRALAAKAGCLRETDRDTLQAYLHHLAGIEPPQWGGYRPGSGAKPKKQKKSAKK